ncbi:MAG: hypothetical protein JWL96_1929 [Sphingomonas bacterium]|uniref:hypothetical protein n=1 Tax=Sphingomonas bacterium TaxID=1895847 RepID=UPI00260C8E20|nr:hypothetical protein [Sphingomonas bacterium]MDB5709859.1 hypothetical protein [Sphingomonas bacterium]
MTSRGFLLSLAAAVAGLTATAGAQVKPSTAWADKTIPVEIFAQFPMIDQPRITPEQHNPA